MKKQTTTRSIRVDVDLLESAELYSRRTGRSLNRLVTDLLEQAVNPERVYTMLLGEMSRHAEAILNHASGSYADEPMPEHVSELVEKVEVVQDLLRGCPQYQEPGSPAEL